MALVQVEQLLPQLVAMAAADTVAIERDPASAIRTLAAKVAMESERAGAQFIAKVTRSQAGRTVIRYGGTDRQEIRAEAQASGKFVDVARMDDAQIDAAIMLVASEAFIATSAMFDSVKAQAAARTLEVEASIRASVQPRVTTIRERREYPFGAAGYEAAKKHKGGRSGQAVLSYHIVDRDFERFGR